MSDFVATCDALRTKLKEFTALPLFWPNDKNQPSLDVAPKGYVYSEVEPYDGRSIALGGTDYRDSGEFNIYVCVPRGTRARTAEGYAQQIRALFQPNNVTGVTIWNRKISSGRESEFVGAVNGPAGRVWCVPVTIDWFSDRKESP